MRLRRRGGRPVPEGMGDIGRAGRTFRAAAAALILLALLLAAPLPLSAHTVTPEYISVVDGVQPPLPGVTIGIQPGTPGQLVVRNPTGTDLVVLTYDGTPFLRIGPAGVEGNLNAREWYLANAPGRRNIPPRAKRGVPPEWQLVSKVPEWAWFDGRLDVTKKLSDEGAPPTPTGTEPTIIDRWSVPMRYGATDVKVDGHLEAGTTTGSVVVGMTSPAELAPGVTVKISTTRPPEVTLTNVTDQTVTVIGRGNEPFARIGPDGVAMNLRSLTYLDERLVRELPPTEVLTDPGAPPQWQNVGTDRARAWIDLRATYPLERPPRDVVAQQTQTKLVEWAIPILVGAQRAEIRGTTSWVPDVHPILPPIPLNTGGPSPVLRFAGIAGFLLLALLVLFLWYRVRSRPAPVPAGRKGGARPVGVGPRSTTGTASRTRGGGPAQKTGQRGGRKVREEEADQQPRGAPGAKRKKSPPARTPNGRVGETPPVPSSRQRNQGRRGR